MGIFVHHPYSDSFKQQMFQYKNSRNVAPVTNDLDPLCVRAQPKTIANTSSRRRLSPPSEHSVFGMTPSFSSVMSQIKRNRRSRTTSVSSASSSASIESPHSPKSHSYTSNSSSLRKYSDSEFIGDWFGTLNCHVIEETFGDHPLDDNFDEGTHLSSLETQLEPHVKLVNLQDLNLHDSYSLRDILQFYPPVYQRNASSQKRRTSVDLTIDELKKVGTAQMNNKNSNVRRSMIYEEENVEMEHWPTAQNDAYASNVTEQSNTTNGFTSAPTPALPIRRTRQQTLNPNFLKLYALEMSCKLRNIIPDLNVDEQVLRRLTYDDIWALDIPSATKSQDGHSNVPADISPYQIKLALITRKKLWSDMITTTRDDMLGDSAPWKMKFVPTVPEVGDKATCQDDTSSLVRMHSDLKPWSASLSSTMLRPCGKIVLGKGWSNSNIKGAWDKREVQYVVKGWCDSRFFNQTSA